MGKAKLTVLGIGNVLMGDEGVGVRLLEAVRDGREWPEDIEFIDGGAGGMGLLNVLEEAERLVVFDAAEMGLPPGEHRVIVPAQLHDESTEHRASMHDVPFTETLDLCARFFHAPETVKVLAVQPKTVDLGSAMTEDVKSAFDLLVRAGTELVEAEYAAAK